MKKVHSSLLVLALGASLSLSGYAAVSAEEAVRLDKDLTPVGAERGGNADGSIPAWTGGMTGIPDNIDANSIGSYFPDPFAGDKPLFIITAANIAQYKDKLTDGQLALFKKYPDTFRMPIYKTRRTAALPQWVYKNIKQNAMESTLTPDGNGVLKAYGGVPFPIPSNGLEAIWNHMLRYKGETSQSTYQTLTVQRNGKYTVQTSSATQMFPYYQKDGQREGFDKDYFMGMYVVSQPARQNGEVTLVRDPINQSVNPRKAWIYLPGQRRVRRAPNIAYDAPQTATNGSSTVDDTWMFSGSPERFDWKLVGKQELYIPYNNYKLDLPAKYSEVIQQGAAHLNPDKERYELHRVWVVEAILKEGQRHIYSKRRFYIDEDSWNISIADNYDTRGNLWRHNFVHLINVYNYDGFMTMVAQAYLDLNAGTMGLADMHSEASGNYRYNKPMKESFFTPASVRKLSRR